MESCRHLEKANLQMKGKTQGCEECEKIGSDWVHLNPVTKAHEKIISQLAERYHVSRPKKIIIPNLNPE